METALNTMAHGYGSARFELTVRTNMLGFEQRGSPPFVESTFTCRAGCGKGCTVEADEGIGGGTVVQVAVSCMVILHCNDTTNGYGSN